MEKEPLYELHAEFIEKIKEPPDGIALLGKPLGELLDYFFTIGLQGDVKGARKDNPIEVFYLHEFELFQDSHLPKDRSQGPGLFCRAHTAELVEGYLELEPTPDEARGAPARNIVPFKEKNLTTSLGKGECRCQTAVACPDDNRIIIGHMCPP